MKTFNVTSLSVTELEELERTLSTQLIKVRNGIIDDSYKGNSCSEVEDLISNQLLSVHNQLTAKKIRG